MRYTLAELCAVHQISRQGYYQRKKREQMRTRDEEKILRAVDQIRAELPRLGGRKLYHNLKDQMDIGRDKFFDLLRHHDRLVRPRRRHRVRTTDSTHAFKRWTNLAKAFTPTAPNQLWVSDITYVETDAGFAYASLITDAWSRKIIGFDLSDSLSVEGSLEALKMALGQLPSDARVMHHSDRGVQYCCYAYTDLLKEHALTISMAEAGNCYENALAERINGILKGEFYLDLCLGDLAQARSALAEAVRLYNEKRPHLALNYMTPAMKHAA